MSGKKTTKTSKQPAKTSKEQKQVEQMLKNQTFMDKVLNLIEAGKLTEKQIASLHDKVMNTLKLEEIWSIFPELFKAKILDKQDAQVLVEEMQMQKDRVELYPFVFFALSEKLNFLDKKQIQDIKEEVVRFAPIDIAFDMVELLKNTKHLGRDEIEHIAQRVLCSEHFSCFADAIYVFEGLDVFDTEDLEMMWQQTMAIGDVENCIELAETIANEDIATKQDVASLFDELVEIVSTMDLNVPEEKFEAKIAVSQILQLANAFWSKKMFTPKMIATTKQILLKVFKGENDEIEMVSLLANIARKNLFDETELKAVKTRFMKKIKEISENLPKKSSKQANKNCCCVEFPSFGSVALDDFIIDWSKIFSNADKKLLEEICIKAQNLDLYQSFVTIAKKEIPGLDKLMFCDSKCSCCH